MSHCENEEAIILQLSSNAWST